jgi:hypothetical protein
MVGLKFRLRYWLLLYTQTVGRQEKMGTVFQPLPIFQKNVRIYGTTITTLISVQYSL